LLELGRATGLTQTELGARLRLDKSTVSRLVAGLERRGWLRRERAIADRRAVCLRLTPAGVAMARPLATARAATFAAITRYIPPDDRAIVLGALATLVRAMDLARADLAPLRRRDEPDRDAGTRQETPA
jgi:DNA-binding MarR family transcriptional regulator